jgi:hypothetical protein
MIPPVTTVPTQTRASNEVLGASPVKASTEELDVLEIPPTEKQSLSFKSVTAKSAPPSV